MLIVLCRKHEGHGPALGLGSDLSQCILVPSKLLLVSMPKLLPLLHVVLVPLAQLWRGRQLFGPLVDFRCFLREASRPEAFDQDTLPVVFGSGKICAFEVDHECIPNPCGKPAMCSFYPSSFSRR